MNTIDRKLKYLKENIKSYHDFPRRGIIFRDIFSLMQNPEAFKSLSELLIEHVMKKTPEVQAIVALESRGFLVGPLIALHFGIPFVPIRKKGKLPGELKQISFSLEYGTDFFEIQSDSITSGQKIVIVDDLLATGGTMEAACQLVRQIGAEIIECLVIMELQDLNGRKTVSAPIHSLVQF